MTGSGADGFKTIPGDAPLRVVVVGAGGMGRGWLRTVRASPLVELAGIVDVDRAAAETAVAELGLGGVSVGSDLGEVLDRAGADAVIDVTTPAAHYPVTLEALGRGLPVLGEKPLADSLAEAIGLVEAAEKAGELFMVSQNRRFNRHLWALKEHSARLGGIGILTHEFFKAPRFGGFRDAMDHPLILDMAIHNFDAARFLLDADPVACYCEEYNPDWSWYAGDAASTAIFEMTGGVRFVYTGSWCSDGLQTSWNSAWRVSGRSGSAAWDGEGEPTSEIADVEPSAAPSPLAVPDLPGENLAGSLSVFVHALRTGETPIGECHDNLLSLGMVHAAIESSRTGSRVRIDEVLRAARP